MAQVFETDEHVKVWGMRFGATLSDVSEVGPSIQRCDEELLKYREEARKANEESKLE